LHAVAGNGLLDRRALLGRGVGFAGAMSAGALGSLTAAEPLTAYILALNKLVGENDTINAQALTNVKMPNQDGYIIRFPDAM
jgi:hypothetical protein